jgi:hypothetical protein
MVFDIYKNLTFEMIENKKRTQGYFSIISNYNK